MQIPAKETDAREPDDAPDELRLALVLNGGTSLAVWMGGVVDQIDALRCAGFANSDYVADKPVLAIYARLLKALRLKLTVDVIAGTSAGGINGALLATGIQTGRRLTDVRDLWLELANLSTLVQNPNADPSPRSLLMGNAVALPLLTDAINSRLAAAPDAGLSGIPKTARLIVTGTDVAGVETGPVTDDFGDTIELVDHRVHFRFSCGEIRSGWCPLGVATANVLARAARSSSSFPFAFEPSQVDEAIFPAGTSYTLRTRNGTPAFAGGAAATRWMIDGGALDNSPIVPVLTEIQRRSADVPVRRVLVFVIPYGSLASPGGLPSDGPGLASVIGTTFNLPRDVPAFDDIVRLTRYLHERDGIRRADDALQALQDGELAELGNSLVGRYRRLRAQEVVVAVALRNENVTDEQIDAGEGLISADFELGLDEVLAPILPPVGPSPPFLATTGGIGAASVAASSWGWGGEPVRRAGRRVLERIREARGALPLDAPRVVRDRLRNAQREAHLAMALIPAEQPDRGTTLEAGIEATAEFWGNQTNREAAHSALIGVAGAIKSARAAVASGGRPLPRAERSLLLDQRPFEEAEDWAGRLLVVDVATQTLIGLPAGTQPPQVGLRFLRLSADAEPPAGIAGIASPQDKLYGLRLGHFAGFAAAGWRANDWMWGRLDGATRLVDVLLDEQRIREAGITEGALSNALGVEVTADSETELPNSTSLDEWRSRARDQLHQAILEEELPVVSGYLGTAVPATGGVIGWLAAYVAAHNQAARIDEAVKSVLKVPEAEKLVARMVRTSTRMARAPWYVGTPIRALDNKIAKWLINKL